jgi:demethylspheroidene O-methyltransferase
MADTAQPGIGPSLRRKGLAARWNALLASPWFQARVARVPGLRRIARAEGEAIFELVGGFVKSQVLAALVGLGVLDRLARQALPAADLARAAGVPEDRMEVLLRAGCACGLVRRRRNGPFALTRRGAVLLGVPGLTGMIAHHRVLYADLAEPEAFFRGETEPALAAFWPYVFGNAGTDPATAAAYSRLMTDTQGLVADETLRMVDLKGVRRLLDVGGGRGAFLIAAGRRYPGLELALFDLPEVVAEAGRAFREAGLERRAAVVAGSFRTDPLPAEADAISLVRVLYDHHDGTVRALLARVFEALPPGGRVIVSEPMSGGARPDPVTDTYFAVYTLAMQTGRARSAEEISALLSGAGFTAVRARPGYRPFVTSVVEATRPA